MAYNREEIVKDKIVLAPDNLKLEVGEIKQIQLITDLTEIRWETSPDYVCNFNSDTRDVEGLVPGNFVIKCIGVMSNGKETSASITIVVEEAVESKPLRILMHNRNTNRLVSIINKRDDGDKLEYKLPSTTGTLLIDGVSEKNTGSLLIHTPTIISPLEENRENYSGIIKASDYQAKAGYTGKHTYTEWQYSTDEFFREEFILDTVKYETGNLNEGSTIYKGLTLYIRVRYGSDNYFSNWSKSIKITVPLDTKEGATNTLSWGDSLNYGYYGIVPDSIYRGTDDTASKELIIDYFMGDWEFISNYPSNIGLFYKGSRIGYDGKIYYLKKQINNVNDMKTKRPDITPEYFELDTREGMPDPSNFLFYSSNLGLHSESQSGTIRSHQFGKSLDPKNNIARDISYTNNINAAFVNLGAIENTKLDGPVNKWNNKWIKAISKGKVIFFLAKPCYYNLSWFDVTGANLAHGVKTIRYGSTLYRWRLLTEEEYYKFIVDLPKEKPELGEIIEHWENEIIEDYYTGNVKSVVDLEHNIVGIETKKRCCSYRPVLEVIEVGNEPYTHWPKGAGNDSNFKYNSKTDTGYFGTVKEEELLGFEELCLKSKNINGTMKRRGAEFDVYYKFYWHGMVIYIPPLLKIGNINVNGYFENTPLIMPYKYSNLDPITLNKDNVNYVFSLLSCCSFTSLINNEFLVKSYELYNNSMYFELIMGLFNSVNKTIYCYWANINDASGIFNNIYLNNFNNKDVVIDPSNYFYNLLSADLWMSPLNYLYVSEDNYIYYVTNISYNNDDNIPIILTIKNYKETNIPREYKERTYYDNMVKFEYAELENYTGITNNYPTRYKLGAYDKKTKNVILNLYTKEGTKAGSYTYAVSEELTKEGVFYFNSKNNRVQIVKKLNNGSYLFINQTSSSSQPGIISNIEYNDESLPKPTVYEECNNCPVCRELQLLDGGVNDGETIENVVNKNLCYPVNLTHISPLIPRELPKDRFTTAKCTCGDGCRYKKS